jgi:7,8-dihydropterin-6-yl-methyl-4-(beta-D-ribofuranosyl)aminobenzene 5'-phosphate synthase
MKIMSALPIPLKEVSRIEVLTLMDNYSDNLLKDTDVVKRPSLVKGDEVPRDTLVAEHGLCLFITFYGNGGKHTMLMDTGYTEIGVPYNMARLGVDPKEIETIVMSHAHQDHTGALHPVLERIGGPVPMVLHPGAFQFPRFKELADGKKLRFPRNLVREDLEARNVRFIETREPTLILGDFVLVSGEVERKTDFEKGLPGALLEKNGKLVEDPMTDDQSLVFHLKDKGLVIISGCSHSGIVNTLMYAKKIAGSETVHAVLGGFHLGGPDFEPIIDRTVEELKRDDPEIIVPMHCTGWKAIHRVSEVFPDAFVLNTVGSTITLT